MQNTPTHFIYHGKATGKDKGGKGSTITLEYQPLADGITIMLPYDQRHDGYQLVPDEPSA